MMHVIDYFVEAPCAGERTAVPTLTAAKYLAFPVPSATLPESALRAPSALGSTSRELRKKIEMTAQPSHDLDALLPAEMAVKAEQIGIKKANMSRVAMFVLAILAGAFISMGAIFATTAVAGAGNALPYGVTRLLAGVAFSLGLILVIVGGAELFTGNALIVMAWANRKVSTRLLLSNWVIVYAGNFLGAASTALLVFFSGQFAFGQGAIGAAALSTATAKVGLGFAEAIALGVLCNALVCLAVWLTFSARTTADRILAIVPPISAFVAAGFEHSIANMYFVPIGLFIKAWAPGSFWSAIGKSPADYASLTWSEFFVRNLLPVTIGNIIGGAVLVGAVYWLVYLRPASAVPKGGAAPHDPATPPKPAPAAE
jgi:formate transporter